MALGQPQSLSDVCDACRSPHRLGHPSHTGLVPIYLEPEHSCLVENMIDMSVIRVLLFLYHIRWASLERCLFSSLDFNLSFLLNRSSLLINLINPLSFQFFLNPYFYLSTL